VLHIYIYDISRLRVKLEVITTLYVTLFSSIFFSGTTAPGVQRLVIIEASRSFKDRQHSAGLHWTSDQLVAETSTWQHTALKRDGHPCRRRDLNPQSLKSAATDQHIRSHGHWDWCFLLLQNILLFISEFYTTKSRNPEILNSVRVWYNGLVTWLIINLLCLVILKTNTLLAD